jgi:hypothetical protein
MTKAAVEFLESLAATLCGLAVHVARPARSILRFTPNDSERLECPRPRRIFLARGTSADAHLEQRQQNNEDQWTGAGSG